MFLKNLFSINKLYITDFDVAIIEGPALAAALFLLPHIDKRLTHFTWWGLASLFLYDFIVIVDGYFYIYHAYRIRLLVLFIQFAILAGVIGMSIAECDLLRDAHDDVGDAMYFFGDFIMHKWPSVRIILALPYHFTHIYLSATEFRDSVLQQYTNAVFLVLIYYTDFHVMDIYGCNMHPFTGATGMILIITLSACAYYFLAVNRKKSLSRNRVESLDVI